MLDQLNLFGGEGAPPQTVRPAKSENRESLESPSNCSSRSCLMPPSPQQYHSWKSGWMNTLKSMAIH
jgi:hypothetical protein